MPNGHANILSHLHFPNLKKQLNELYIVHAINSFAFSLVGIFIPIYLLQVGFSLTQVFTFYAVRYTSIFAFAFLGMYIAQSTGLKHILYARLPIMISFLYFLSTLDGTGIFYLFVSIIHGLQVALYWMPMHSLFIKNSTRKHLGEEVGKWFSFPKMLTVFGPLLGGLIVIKFGFNVLFLVVSIILLLSIFPLYYTKEIKPHVSFKLKEGLKMFKKYPMYFFAAMGEGVFLATEGIIWPIFVFLILGDILAIGYVGTLLGVGSASFILFLGRMLDKYDMKRILHIGVPFVTVLWITRIFATTEYRIYVITLVAGFLVSLLTVPFTSITYRLAKKNNIDEFILFRETALAISRVLVMVFAIAVAGQLWTLFLLAGASNLLLLLL